MDSGPWLGADASVDIKPQNIMVETPAIKEMFNQAPSVAFEATQSSLDPPNDFYMKSAQITSAQEDLAIQPDVSVRLADFGTCECSSLDICSECIAHCRSKLV